MSSLAPAFSHYTNDPGKGNRMARIQGDSIGLAQSLSAAVEAAYHWQSARGLVVVSVAIASIEYDEDTRALLSDVKKADALGGARGNSFLQQSVARGFQAAGESGGGAPGIAMMGVGLNAAGGAMGGLQQPTGPTPPQQEPPAQGAPHPAASSGKDLVAKLAQYKSMLDQGLITQEDYDAAKAKALGL